jgi:hypothetical protein
LEAGVIEAMKRRSVDVSHGVVGDEKMLFPTHEDVIRIFQAIVVEGIAVERLYVRVERQELAL